MKPLQAQIGSAAAVGFIAFAALVHYNAIGFLVLALCGLVVTCGLLAASLWHLTYANERIESLLAVATASVADRISSLVADRTDGESAEWANLLISAYLWPRLILPLIERDVHRDAAAKLANVFLHRHDPDTAAKVPDFIENLEIETFALGNVAPVFTAVRCVPPREAARAVGLPPDAPPADARVYDLDTTISSERVDVTLRAFVGGSALQALDWVGSVAGALQPKGGISALDAAAALLQPSAAPANTSLAVRVRRLDFSARLRIALRTESEVFFFGLLPEPKPRCRVGLEVTFQTRAGTNVALPLSRVPGMASFLEATLLREIAGAIRVPNSLPRDLRPIMQMALLPPGTRNPLPPPPSLEVCTTLLHATLNPATTEAFKRDNALGLPAGPLLCAIASESGKRRELAVDLVADAHLNKRTDNFRVVCVPPPSAMGVMETVTFKLRRAPDLTRRLGAVRDVAEGLTKMIGDRARAAAAAAVGEQTAGAAPPQQLLDSPTIGVGKLRIVRLTCGVVLLLTAQGDVPRVLAVTPTGGADAATRARGLNDISPLPGAALVDVELFPPGEPAHASTLRAMLRVRIELQTRSSAAAQQAAA